MTNGSFDFALAIGGSAGQGIATPGDTLARIVARRGLHLSTYNAYQSIIRGRAHLPHRPHRGEGSSQPRRQTGYAARPQPGHDGQAPPAPGLRRGGPLQQRRRFPGRRRRRRPTLPSSRQGDHRAPARRPQPEHRRARRDDAPPRHGLLPAGDEHHGAVRPQGRGHRQRKRPRRPSPDTLTRRRTSFPSPTRCRRAASLSPFGRATKRLRWAARRRASSSTPPIR